MEEESIQFYRDLVEKLIIQKYYDATGNNTKIVLTHGQQDHVDEIWNELLNDDE